LYPPDFSGAAAAVGHTAAAATQTPALATTLTAIRAKLIIPDDSLDRASK
jgi:hypothetical protein